MNRTICLSVFVLLLFSGNVLAQEIWHIKVIDENGQFLDVKAVDAAGRLFDVKAIVGKNGYITDVKALNKKEKWPVKVLVSEAPFAPVKAIRPDGTIVDIKALTADGKRLDIKGVSAAGNIIHIKAIGPNRSFYGIKAISKLGQLRDVKGVKFSNASEEGTVNNVPFHAHVKALLPGNAQGPAIWHVKAVHPDGRLLKLKALDGNGKQHDVKALVESGNSNMLDIKAFIEGAVLPVKVLKSDDKLSPVKAIGKEGTIYNIKVLMPDNTFLDVKGVERSGKIIHIKAIGPDGTHFGVKACSPSGKFYDVKGVKSSSKDVEGTVNGVPFHAHIKALPQSLCGR